jgi:hypothetical protein
MVKEKFPGPRSQPSKDKDITMSRPSVSPVSSKSEWLNSFKRRRLNTSVSPTASTLTAPDDLMTLDDISSLEENNSMASPESQQRKTSSHVLPEMDVSELQANGNASARQSRRRSTASQQQSHDNSDDTVAPTSEGASENSQLDAVILKWIEEHGTNEYPRRQERESLQKQFGLVRRQFRNHFKRILNSKLNVDANGDLLDAEQKIAPIRTHQQLNGSTPKLAQTAISNPTSIPPSRPARKASNVDCTASQREAVTEYIQKHGKRYLERCEREKFAKRIGLTGKPFYDLFCEIALEGETGDLTIEEWLNKHGNFYPPRRLKDKIRSYMGLRDEEFRPLWTQTLKAWENNQPIPVLPDKTAGEESYAAATQPKLKRTSSKPLGRGSMNGHANRKPEISATELSEPADLSLIKPLPDYSEVTKVDLLAKDLHEEIKKKYTPMLDDFFEECRHFCQAMREQNREFFPLDVNYAEFQRLHEDGHPWVDFATLDSFYLGLGWTKEIGCGNKDISEVGPCGVLVTTQKELLQVHQNGKQIPENIGCIVVKDPTGAERANERLSFFENRLLSGFEDSQPEYQNYAQNDSGLMTLHMDATAFVRRIRDHRADSRFRRLHQSRTIKEGLPRNYLSWTGSLFQSEVPDPEALLWFRSKLLSYLCDRSKNIIRDKHGQTHGAGKEDYRPGRNIDLEACIRFVLFGERASLSLYHVDVLNGTWVQCLSGVKGWYVYQGPWTSKEQAEFRDYGTQWKPAAGTMKMILLEPGDTLIMRPGHLVIHAVLTLEDSLMAGGMMWPESAKELEALFENLQYIALSPMVTNEHHSKQLPEILESLKIWMEMELAERKSRGSPVDGSAAPDGQVANAMSSYPAAQFTLSLLQKLNSTIKKLKPLLSCSSKCRNNPGPCTDDCPCAEGNEVRTSGCTLWCHEENFYTSTYGCIPYNMSKDIDGKPVRVEFLGARKAQDRMRREENTRLLEKYANDPRVRALLRTLKQEEKRRGREYDSDSEPMPETYESFESRRPRKKPRPASKGAAAASTPQSAAPPIENPTKFVHYNYATTARTVAKLSAQEHMQSAPAGYVPEGGKTMAER